MHPDSSWFSLLILLAVPVLLGHRACARLDPPGEDQGGGRLHTLDGLRGYLALAVVLHHGAVYRGWIETGTWDLPRSHLPMMIGHMGVAMFFMVTGYLFWSRLVAAGGRMDWVALYVGRVFRLGPIYLLAIVLMLVAIGIVTDWTLRVPLADLAGQIAVWLPIGVVKGPRINGYAETSQLLAGVTWTLRYEWLFYACLPFAAWALRRGAPAAALSYGLLVLALGLAWALPDNRDAYVSVLFAIGMVAAVVRRSIPRPVPWHDGWASVAVIALLAVVILGFDRAYAPIPMLLMGVAFLLVVSGCTVFGGLTHRGAERLGHVSYGVYLLQGLALALTFRTPAGAAIAAGSGWGHWAMVIAAVLLVVAVAALAHIVIERPAIAAGRRLLRRRHRGLASHEAGNTMGLRPSPVRDQA